MSAIYKPKGRAKEYCDLAINLYRGCGHGCKYCYAPAATYQTRENFRKPTPRKNIIELIKKEAPKYSGREVLLCFTCDPYQPINMKYELARQAIKILHKNNIAVRILTKGGHSSMRDFDLLSHKPNLSRYGATLTFIDDDDSLEHEPWADLPYGRLRALRNAKDSGIPTWVSLEPVIDTEQTLELIRISHSYVDEYKLGKLNYDKRANEIDWRKFANEAISLFEKFNKKYYIKNDLRSLL